MKHDNNHEIKLEKVKNFVKNRIDIFGETFDIDNFYLDNNYIIIEGFDNWEPKKHYLEISEYYSQIFNK